MKERRKKEEKRRKVKVVRDLGLKIKFVLLMNRSLKKQRREGNNYRPIIKKKVRYHCVKQCEGKGFDLNQVK